MDDSDEWSGILGFLGFMGHEHSRNHLSVLFPMKIATFLLLFSALIAEATSYTEFYCNKTGTNINAGSTTNATPTYSTTAGDWVASTGVFTKTGADRSGVSVGMWVSVYPVGGTTDVFVGLI